MNRDVKVSEVLLEPIPLAVRQAVQDSVLVQVQWREWRDETMSSMVYELCGYALSQRIGSTVVRFYVPADWWAAFKERWYPAWALRRWPAHTKCLEREVSAWEIADGRRVAMPPDWRTGVRIARLEDERA